VELTPRPSLQARNFIMIIFALFLFIVGLSLYLNLANIHRRYEELATAIGRSVFQQLVAVRKWSTQHGGIYLQATKPFDSGAMDQANTLTTSDGRTLMRIHPEYLTRLISDILVSESGISIGVTSLKLTSPDNAADPWERTVLEKFDKGIDEQLAIVGHGRSATFRYMAPLRTEEPCLICHGKQGYKLGDIRGGLSVSFSYVPFQKAISKGNAQIYVVHAVFLLTGLAIIFFLGRKLITRIVELQEASSHIRKLEGLLPICASCKKVRAAGADPNAQESWIAIETFIRDRTDAEFSHGFCPECLKKLYNWEHGE
jgi:two-component system, NtrC family, sensor kinase